MPIPDFQTLMLPLLTLLGDEEEHYNADIYTNLSNALRLTDEEKEQLLPSGRQTVFTNRAAWAKSYLKQAGLVTSPRRGCYTITERGKDILAQNVSRIDIAYLMQFEDFRRFREKSDAPNEILPPTEGEKTPQEYMELGYQKLLQELTADLLMQVKSCQPQFFEHLVMDLLLAMGYGGSRKEAGEVVGGTSDGGIDGIINEDKLGLDVIYIQAKRWEGPVGRPEIQKFAGALLGKKASKGIFITTSLFTTEAQDYARSIGSKIVLVDGSRLAKLMMEHNVGVTTTQAYEVKRIDIDYFLED
ncbi:MAG: restriction endonuclease [Desulfovibrionaceae bacterium]|jgi:restriction system protein|uniref:restriction endonuclease n=1 Tax=Desulfovibrio aminophilus TaxID=81425 RepID=UPI0039ED65E8